MNLFVLLLLILIKEYFFILNKQEKDYKIKKKRRFVEIKTMLNQDDNERTSLLGKEENDVHHIHRVYGICWIQLLIYVLATFANALTSATFAPIVSQTTLFYSISLTEVNTLAIVFLFLYPVGTGLSIYLSRKFSLRLIMIIGSISNLGIFIRFCSLINPETRYAYASLLIGQIFPAIGAPFFLNSAALFSARWFDPSQRDVATSIASMANPLGKIPRIHMSIVCFELN